MATDRARFMISVDDETFKEIEDFQRENRFATRSQATLSLIIKGLKAVQREEKEKENNG